MTNMNIFNIFKRSNGFEEFARRHPVGFLKVPKSISQFPSLGASPKFIAPNEINERPRCTKTEDQGEKPWCAAYAATQFAENILWRKRGYPEDIDPTIIYRQAKRVDGNPNEDGTTIPAVLDSLKANGYFDFGNCPTRIVNNSVNDVKFAIHRFGVMLGGFMVTEEWYRCNPKKTAVCSKDSLPGLGGHCVLICGYNKDGVFILNSWGKDWGEYGYALITWKCFNEQFIYGGILDNCLDGMKMGDSQFLKF